MSKVYILSDYGEYGSEHVVATLDKSKVELLAEKYWGCVDLDRLQYASGHPTAREELLGLLEADTANKESGIDLFFGWGGVQLHIVELE